MPVPALVQAFRCLALAAVRLNAESSLLAPCIRPVWKRPSRENASCPADARRNGRLSGHSVGKARDISCEF